MSARSALFVLLLASAALSGCVWELFGDSESVSECNPEEDIECYCALHPDNCA